MPSDDAWSIPALRQHIDQRFTDAEKHLIDAIERIDERHRTFEVQVAEAKAASNEWRGALNDRERATVTRSEWESRNKSMEARFDQAISNTNALLSAMSTEMRDGNSKLENLIASMHGGKSARDDLRVWILAALSAASIIFGIVMTLVATR